MNPIGFRIKQINNFFFLNFSVSFTSEKEMKFFINIVSYAKEINSGVARKAMWVVTLLPDRCCLKFWFLDLVLVSGWALVIEYKYAQIKTTNWVCGV
jgi:hypothetical protein